MKVRIEADGRRSGTFIREEGGSKIDGISAIAFEHRAGSDPEIRLELCLISVGVVGEAKVYGPGGKEVKKVIFADGSEVEY